MKKKLLLGVSVTLLSIFGIVGDSLAKADDTPPTPTIPDGNDPFLSMVCHYQKISLDEAKGEIKCSGTGKQCCILIP